MLREKRRILLRVQCNIKEMIRIANQLGRIIHWADMG
jgi:hypothetical protein